MTLRATDSSGRPSSPQCRQGIPQGRDPVKFTSGPGLNLSNGNPTGRNRGCDAGGMAGFFHATCEISGVRITNANYEKEKVARPDLPGSRVGFPRGESPDLHPLRFPGSWHRH